MAGFLESLGASPAVVVGISMGGTVALDLAIRFPEIVRLLVLANTFACLRPDSLSGWGYFLKRYAVFSLRGLPEQAEFVAQRIFPDPGQTELRRLLVEQVTQADPKVYRKAMRALGFFDDRKRLKEIQAKTLVVSGGCDTTLPLKNQRELVEGIPNVRQVIIAKAGHAVTVDQPIEFNAVMLEFIKSGLMS
jgi:pimeloyl-ACP methyl ester carboxylesterase